MEFDGDFWHSKPETKEKDKVKQKFMEEKGFIFIRIKECDYNNDKQYIVDFCVNNIIKKYNKLKNHLQKRRWF